ncbi:coenzyme F420-reducing hydrogenase, FrhD protein [Methanofollis aquaemaris]|uniref:Coenzyme F420-reducing hydrogenase, FrhD protein n=1 Tax=Methanofollis aquaemaris TaxID=126734 RepID=A0A8A3S7A4_9EURY|nr:coenzyme F420-reducing hydrogenase, FrhD protein [Methanofollis aquaemaris]QSZ67486.1 coenzyme F420-reducing hydrogenase, FrhD protein [Methanofollis aquaemaris]
MLYPEIVIVGCGNPLFADDGLGPAVIEELDRLQLPDNVKVIDGGLGAPHFIFTLIDPAVTKKIVVIDIAEFGAEPGSLAKFSVEDLPPGSYRDAHSWDLTEPLGRLKDQVEITIFGVQPKRVSSPDMEIGLSEEVQKAIPKVVRYVLAEIGVDYGATIKAERDHLWKEGAAQVRGDPEGST